MENTTVEDVEPLDEVEGEVEGEEEGDGAMEEGVEPMEVGPTAGGDVTEIVTVVEVGGGESLMEVPTAEGDIKTIQVLKIYFF